MRRGVPGGVVSQVEGIARAAGLQAGDRVVAINGRPLRDLIDYRFYADGPEAAVQVLREGETLHLPLRRSPGEDWGITFAEPLFDGIRRCQNRCLFCFLDQLPAGWRRSLYLRDDDYRLSFLYGNFVTLTNLRPEDYARIQEQHLSPLYISVHATDPALRRFLLGRPDIPDIRRQLARLGRSGSTFHTQVVLCPGINDGEHLWRTLADLDRLYPAVQSVSLVPVGLTRFRQLPPPGLEGAAAHLRPYRAEEAHHLTRQVLPLQKRLRRRRGRTWLYLADEFYLLAGRPVPAARFYDGFPQLENGVGLLRQLRDDWFRTRRRLPAALPRPLEVTLVCGLAVAPTLRSFAQEASAQVEGLVMRVLALENHTFGPTVTVSGLLTGEEFFSLAGRPDLGEVLFLPRSAFDLEGNCTLDDLALEDLREVLGRPVFLAERMEEVWEGVQAHLGT